MNSPDCPWVKFHGVKPYHFQICEENLCAWIRQPANTWSNVAIFLLAVSLIYRWRKEKIQSDLVLGGAMCFVGFWSFLCHASGMPIFSFLDLSGILIFLSVLAAMMLVRGGLVLKKYGWFSFMGITCATIFGQILLGKAQIIVLIVFLLLLVALELGLSPKTSAATSRRKLLLGLTCLLGGVICLAIDYSKIFCNPQQHVIQFHAIWHLLSGASMYFTAAHMRQFDIRLSE
jgi:hypothetical protein